MDIDLSLEDTDEESDYFNMRSFTLNQKDKSNSEIIRLMAWEGQNCSL